MFKFALYLAALLVIFGCSSIPNEKKTTTVNDNQHSSDVTLSHVQAYLLIGNIQKAEQLFHTINDSAQNAQSMLVLAELHAAMGNSIEAQKAFLNALADSQFTSMLNKTAIPVALLDYFCEQKKWPALQGYGKAMLDAVNKNSTSLANDKNIQNETFTKIGLCFFYQQRWEDANYWLASVDLTKQVNPLVYLALARVSVEQNQIKNAQELIRQYDQKKQTVDAQSMWTSIEVYLALKQPDMVKKVGENMRALFSFNEYTSKYILLTKRGRIQALTTDQTPSRSLTVNANTDLAASSRVNQPEGFIHLIQKGETLYQLSKRYGVTAPELMSWNPDLVVDDIALGTPIRIMAPKTRLE